MLDEKKLRQIEQELDEQRIKIKGLEDLKVWGDVFDTQTLLALYKLANKGIIKAMGGAIATGKEANVFHAIGSGGRELGVKIYRIATSDFKAMQEYIIGDPRFEKIKHSKKDIVFAWTKKEYRNLDRAMQAGVRVPQPMIAERNILIMEFIGKDGVAAPLLREAEIKKPKQIFQKVVENMKLLHQKAKLVHADLSEYNIMYFNDEPVFIDMGQSLVLEHPNSEEFLKRDVKNIVRFFQKLRVKCTEEEVLKKIKNK
ncbi:MAG: serine protein kinase RIO [Methanocellales archaeon]